MKKWRNQWKHIRSSLAAYYLTQERDRPFSGSLLCWAHDASNQRIVEIVLAMGILNVHLDSFKGATQRPLLHQGPPLAFDSYSYWILQHFDSLSHHKMHFKPLCLIIYPWGCQAPACWAVFCAYPPRLLKETNKGNSSKSEILNFIIKCRWEPKHQEVKNVGWEGAVGFLCVNYSLQGCKIWRSHLRVCFGFIREIPKPWFGIASNIPQMSFYKIIQSLVFSKFGAGHTHIHTLTQQHALESSNPGLNIQENTWIILTYLTGVLLTIN